MNRVDAERYRTWKAALDAKWREFAEHVRPTVDRIVIGMCWGVLRDPSLRLERMRLGAMDVTYPRTPQEAMDLLRMRRLVRFGRPHRKSSA